jgi:nitronate monooxygenase
VGDSVVFQFSKLSIPLVQAPMAGGVTTPALVAAVTNSGGLGSFGFAYSTPEQIAQNLRAARALTQGPINANLFVFKAVSTPSAETEQAAIEALQKLHQKGEYPGDLWK